MSVSNLKQLLESITELLAAKTSEILLSEHTADNLNAGRVLAAELEETHNNLIKIVQRIAQIKNECNSKVAEMHLDLNHCVESAYIYNTMNNMLSYTGRSKTVAPKARVECNSTIEKKKDSGNTRTLIREIGYYGKFQHVKSLQEIPQMFYWFEGSNNNGGLYCSPSPNVYVKVPFPEIVDNARDFSRARSICCKYGTKENCLQRRRDVAQYKGTETRVCNFTHKNEKYVKISTASRCPSNPCFGAPATLANDLMDISMTDVRQLMLYGINDMAIASVWFDYRKNANNNIPTMQVFDSLEYCTGLQ